MKSLKYLYRIGRGPSSSHTMGPEKICREFLRRYPDAEKYSAVLYGSLALTGKGHNTDKVMAEVFSGKNFSVKFDTENNKIKIPNTMDLTAFYPDRTITKRAYSPGGGAIQFDGEENPETDIYPHKSFFEISEYIKKHNMRICDYVRECEGDEIYVYLHDVWQQMKQTIKNGIFASGTLPGGLGVERKAKLLYMSRLPDQTSNTYADRMISSYAYACGEENAGGGTIVTAPTCGSCGVVPAVLLYMQLENNFTDDKICEALATGGIIGNLIKENASISGAECGCQAEIGSACAMASAALCELSSLCTEQIEYASEIAIEHHLGLTCDPVMGLVQIPCIERNAVAAMRAMNNLSLSRFLTYTRKVSFDTIVETMKQTGKDLNCGYRETSRNGLAKFYISVDPKLSN